MNRETIHYTVELLRNGNFNIYKGDMCFEHNLVWKNISPDGAAECLGGWVKTWAENAKKEQEE